jgi:secreted PhoX family phosphatase
MVGRAMAHLMDGTSYELPHLGKAAWENIGPNPGTGVRTVVAATDDSASGQVYVYAGTKNGSPHPIEAAGLANGLLYGVQVAGLAHETDTTTLAPGTPFSLWNFGDVSNRSGIELEADSLAAGVTAFNRPEDGAWDPSNPNDFYFVTTATFPGRSRLWRLRFVDAARPALGGTADMLLDGTEGQHMFDNMIVTHRGRVILQEDPGNQPYLARVWQYDIARDSLALIAQHDPGRFTPGAPDFLTTDEESSGVIEATGILGEGWFLADVQEASPSPDPELVSGGQLLALHIPAGRRF